MQVNCVNDYINETDQGKKFVFWTQFHKCLRPARDECFNPFRKMITIFQDGYEATLSGLCPVAVICQYGHAMNKLKRWIGSREKPWSFPKALDWRTGRRLRCARNEADWARVDVRGGLACLGGRAVA